MKEKLPRLWARTGPYELTGFLLVGRYSLHGSSMLDTSPMPLTKTARRMLEGEAGEVATGSWVLSKDPARRAWLVPWVINLVLRSGTCRFCQGSSVVTGCQALDGLAAGG